VKSTFAIAVGAGVVLSVEIASGRPILASRWWLLTELGGWAACWALAVFAAFRLPGRWAPAAIMVAGIALRVAALAGPPTTSDDLYRYSWDGRVQAAGIDPYLTAPANPRLIELREPWLWPSDRVCATLHRAPGCTRINRPDARTIYPPLAEAWFAAAHRVAGSSAHHKTWQVAGLITEVGVLSLLPIALRRWHRDPRWAALYALSPAPVLEIVNNGHVDGLAVLAVVAAIALLAGPPSRARDIGVGLLIGSAALVKLYPATFILAMAGAAGVTWRSFARATLGALTLAVAAYLPHTLRAGAHVLGYLPGYIKEEHYTSGCRYLLVNAAHVPAPLAGPASALLVITGGLWVAFRRPDPPRAAAILIGTLLLATSPVQPWYAVTLLACATVAAWPTWAVVVAAGYPYFFAVILANPHAGAIGQASFAAAGATALVLAARRVAARPNRTETTSSDAEVQPAPAFG
jgi:hypothetical protein